MSSQGQAVSSDSTTTKPDNNDPACGQNSRGDEHRGLTMTHNPDGWPLRYLSDGRTKGVPSMGLPVSVDTLTQLERIRKLEMREDDIIITAFQKCGTHWVSEIVHMLISGTTDYNTKVKEFNMLEFIDDMTMPDHMTSPRLFNSHLYFTHLPQQLVEKKVKLIHLIRNPKDCAVSYYHHIKQYSSTAFSFDNFIRGYTTDGYTSMSHQSDYLRQMGDFEKTNPDHPIHHVHYEDLKRDPIGIIQELSRFLGVETSQQFCQEVALACGFDRLKQAAVKKDYPDYMAKKGTARLSVYRKGMVGDWKNTFTVSQNEMFDQFLARQEEKGQPYTFRWS